MIFYIFLFWYLQNEFIKFITHDTKLYDLVSFIDGPVAQLDRAFDYESKGRAFESLRVHHFPFNIKYL